MDKIEEIFFFGGYKSCIFSPEDYITLARDISWRYAVYIT